MARLHPSRRTWLTAAAVAVVLGAGIGTVIAASGSDTASGSRLVTSVARRGDVSETVSAPFTLAFGNTATPTYACQFSSAVSVALPNVPGKSPATL